MIHVLVVDDSAVVRQVMTDVLGKDPGIRVTVAGDPLIAMKKMEMQWPDVIVLDVEMPRMDGITFLRKIMEERPTPVVMCSTLTEKGAETTMQALASGAVDIITKPKIGVKGFINEEAAFVIQAVKAAASSKAARVKALRRLTQAAGGVVKKDKTPLNPSEIAMSKTTEGIVAMGTSTGGTQALEVVLTALPRLTPGIVIVQHMPEKFTAAFANRLNDICEIEVLEAKDGDHIIPGRALIAPGGRHMQVKRSGARYYVEISDGPPVSRHRPSVDVLFRSTAKIVGRNALGIIMTGMGDDGAAGLEAMHKEGAFTLAQDEETCIVYGMPNEAVKRGAVDKVIPLGNISAEILKFGKRDERAAKK